MRVCPKCAFSNPDDVPTCVWCNTNIAGVKSIPSSDPDDPEHIQRAAQKQRNATLRNDLFLSGFVYTSAITISAACLGFWSNPLAVAAFFAGAAVVAFAVCQRIFGLMSAPFAQAVFSVAAFIYSGFVSPFMFFAMAAHIFFAGLLCYWTDMIYDMRR